MILFKKENNSLNKRRDFSKILLSFRIITYLNSILIYIYTFKLYNFYIIKKRKASFIIYEIIKYLYF